MSAVPAALGAYQQAEWHLRRLDADWARLVDAVGPCTHRPQLQRSPYEALVRAVAYQQLHARAGDAILARATLEGTVPSLAEARTIDDETLVRRLTALRGVGRWTAEMFLIYSLGRLDVLPMDDHGVRSGWRTVAAWYLWRLPALGWQAAA